MDVWGNLLPADWRHVLDAPAAASSPEEDGDDASGLCEEKQVIKGVNYLKRDTKPVVNVEQSFFPSLATY